MQGQWLSVNSDCSVPKEKVHVLKPSSLFKVRDPLLKFLGLGQGTMSLLYCNIGK